MLVYKFDENKAETKYCMSSMRQLIHNKKKLTWRFKEQVLEKPISMVKKRKIARHVKKYCKFWTIKHIVQILENKDVTENLEKLHPNLVMEYIQIVRIIQEAVNGPSLILEGVDVIDMLYAEHPGIRMRKDIDHGFHVLRGEKELYIEFLEKINKKTKKEVRKLKSNEYMQGWREYVTIN